jgi:cyanate permease
MLIGVVGLLRFLQDRSNLLQLIAGIGMGALIYSSVVFMLQREFVIKTGSRLLSVFERG